MEEWKTIKNCQGYYQVSDKGQIRSVDRVITHKNGVKRFYKGKILEQGTCNGGYPVVNLSINGKRKDLVVHLLVLEAFKEPRPSIKHECNHIDCNKKNNKIENLEWVTRSQNLKHAWDNGLRKPLKGELNPYSKLTESDIIEIKDYYNTGGYRQYQIAEKFGISQGHVSKIIRGIRWW